MQFLWAASPCCTQQEMLKRGELPKGTALCIAEAIPEEYSPEELITNTYHEDMLSDLGIDKTGEILDFNFAARSLTAIV